MILNIFTEIGILFAGMSIPVLVCLILGIILVLIEIFQPGFGVFGIIGGILLLIAVGLRVLQGDGNPLAQIFIMMFMIALICILAFLIMVKTIKKGWISRTALVEKSTAVNLGLSDGTADYANLMDKIGVASSDLKPTGKAEIDNRPYDVTTNGFFIEKGERIKVVMIEGIRIVVKRAE